jgi:hypothetical protein
MIIQYIKEQLKCIFGPIFAEADVLLKIQFHNRSLLEAATSCQTHNEALALGVGEPGLAVSTSFLVSISL